MVIDVRPGDIKAAVKYRKAHLGCCDAFHCPVANAARRVLKTDVGVGEDAIYTFEGNSYQLPIEARAWIERFDAGVKMEPVTFEVEEQTN